MNSVVLIGRLSSEPQTRVLASGSVLYSLELTTTTDDGAWSVPVAWFDPPTVPGFAAGDEVVVVGGVRRRFFRTTTGTQSRTEVVASEVTSTRSRRKVERLVGREADRLGARVSGALRSV